MEFFLLNVVTGIVFGGIYALAALGFVLIYKASEVVSFAQGEMLMVGAYIGWFLSLQLQSWLGLTEPSVGVLLVSFVLTLVLMAGFGFLIERMFLRPMIGEPIIAVIILTLGLASLLDGVTFAIFSTELRNFPQVLPLAPIFIGPVPITPPYLAALGVAVLFIIGLALFFRYSSAGVAMRAVADDQQAAASMGISIKWVFALSWAIAAITAAAGGILLGNVTGVNFTLSLIGLTVFPVVILGGLDSIPGAIIGGLTIGILQNLSFAYLDPILGQVGLGGGTKDVFPFVVLVLILMIKPYGLFGKEIIERV